MKIIEGDFKNHVAQIIKTSSHERLDIKARLLTVRTFRIPDEIQSFTLLSKEEGHSFGRYLLLLGLALTLVGLLIAIPLYFFGKHTEFKVQIITQSGERFVAHGNKDDWKGLKPLLTNTY